MYVYVILKFYNNLWHIVWIFCRLMNVYKKKYSTFLVVKRLEVEVYLFRIWEPKPPTAILRIANNLTCHGPRFVAARDFADDPLQREVFSDVARGCIRTLHTARCVCVYISRMRGGSCLRDGWMCRCDNGLKHDAVGFQCSSVPVLCLLFATLTRKVIASKSKLSLTKIIFLAKEEKSSKNYIIC